MSEPRVISIIEQSLDTSNSKSDELISEAISVLQIGQLMVLPANSSYVIAADAENSAPQRELRRLRQVQENFLPTIIVGSLETLSQICVTDELSDTARELLLTGDLSIVLPTLEDRVFGDEETASIVVNMPSNPLVRNLLEKFGICQIASAGLAGTGQVKNIQSAIDSFGIFIDLYWDLGPLSGRTLTVINHQSMNPKIIRFGAIEKEVLIEAFPNLEIDSN